MEWFSPPARECAAGFVPAPNGFDGPRKGMVFKSGSAGLGYYADRIKAAVEAPWWATLMYNIYIYRKSE